ncbi:MAG: LacI family DNA-binding transcriptional regulator [Anaerolineaceae bacterium]|nr:LacI family DNA-binding transcriptional regulator [Anaerolineaceae bacterium]
MKEKRVTIDDVAKATGVSRQTVSRAINNLAGISPITRERILKTANEMGYRPSGIARGLANSDQHTKTLGIVLPTIDNEFYSAILHGIEDHSSALGYNVFLCDTNEDPQEEFRKIQSLYSLWIDGLIICSSRLNDKQLSIIADQFRPIVLVNRAFQHPTVGNVLIDDRSGTVQAVQHLIDQGHTKIGIILGLEFSRSSQLRCQGYIDTMEQKKLIIKPQWSIHSGAKINSGYLAARHLLTASPELTAIVVYNDVRAAGVLRACNDLNIGIPRDIAIVSHDNIALSSLLIPSLTTVDIPKYQLGYQAITMMMSMLEDKNLQPDTINLSPNLIIRESSCIKNN